MKKFSILATICLFSLLNGYAQHWNDYRVGRKYEGYVITNDGTKIEGYVLAQIRASALHSGLWNDNQTRVEFYIDPNDRNTRTVYSPEDIKEYMINGMVYRTVNYSGGLLSKSQRFLLLQQDGHIARYIWYENEGTDTHPNFKDKIVFQKGNERTFELADYGINFSRKMSALLNDYPELAKKVAQKEKGYRMLNIYEIIDKYNVWYSQKE